VTRWCLLGITTCWIAAENALRHARNNISLVSEVFDKRQIPNSEYVILAGFDESLIKSGVGYLEQIHVFVGSEVDPPLLTELGKLFSPFSSTLFTEESSYRLPVFKDDGSVWEFDELVYLTALKFADDGSSAKTPPTIISLSSKSSSAGGVTSISQSEGSGSGEEEGNKELEENGRERDMGDEVNKDNDSCGNPDKPVKPPGGDERDLREIIIVVDSELYLTRDEQDPFQTLTVRGGLTIEVFLYFFLPLFTTA
jgi:hypothetical protein